MELKEQGSKQAKHRCLGSSPQNVAQNTSSTGDTKFAAKVEKQTEIEKGYFVSLNMTNFRIIYDNRLILMQIIIKKVYVRKTEKTCGHVPIL